MQWTKIMHKRSSFKFHFFFIFDYVLVKLVFRFLQGLVNLQDGILPLLMNNSLKRVFKRSVKVSSWHISLWKVWTVFDWRQNLCLRRGISVLTGGTCERLFCPEGREFEQANLQKFQYPGVARGGMLKYRFDWYIMQDMLKLQMTCACRIK